MTIFVVPCKRNNEVINDKYLSGIKAFNHLPQYIKTLVNDQELFKSTLKRFLYHHAFYSMDEYYECKEDGRV
jgi:hypothetical protein